MIFLRKAHALAERLQNEAYGEASEKETNDGRGREANNQLKWGKRYTPVSAWTA